MRFIDELRKCDPDATIKVTNNQEPHLFHMPAAGLLDAWDELVRDRDYHKQMAEFWEHAAQTQHTP